jgi:hypothetical protein
MISRSLLSGQPPHLDADRGQHLDDPVDLLDASQIAQRRAALVEQGGTQEADGGVLARLDRDRPGELLAADDPQVLGSAGAEGDELAVQALADTRQHLKAEVLLALLDAGHCALAGAEQIGQFALGQALVAACVADQGPDAVEIGGVTHSSTIDHM